MTNHDQFDELLDHALSEYRDAEPLSGLEERVLQRLQSQPTGRRNPWWIWGVVATCAALVLVGVWIGVGAPSGLHLAGWDSNPPPTVTEHETASQKQVAPPATVASKSQASQTVHPASQVNTAAAQRRNAPALVARAETSSSSATGSSQFPTPTPLTAEEHALLALLHSNPSVLRAQRDDAGETEISPLEIKPLAGSATPIQENNNE